VNLRPTLRLAAAAAALGLAACNNVAAPQVSALFDEPSSVAVFRGVVLGGPPVDTSIYPYHPFIAMANAGRNDLAILNGVTDAPIPAPVPLRGLVYPVPGRPLQLVAADLGDRKPDLLVVVTAGDLPVLGGSRLEVIRTWETSGAIEEDSVDLLFDVKDLLVLPFDPAATGSVRIVAALADERIAVVTFFRSTAGDGTGIDVARSKASVVTGGPLGFQPLRLASLPGERTRVFAASTDTLPGVVQGVAEIDVTGTPTFVRALNAHAPTRLVAAMRLAEADPRSTAADGSAFTDGTEHDRVYAVLDESGCGVQAAIACGLVAIDADPTGGDLLPDPFFPASTTFLAPLPIPGRALALAATVPPAVPPSPTEPQFAGTSMRISVSTGDRQTTAAVAIASTDGQVGFADLGRWENSTEQFVYPNVSTKVTPSRPAGTVGAQWLVLKNERTGATALHTDPTALSTAVTLTGGFTPNDRWIVTKEGILPNLSARRAEAGNDGTPWLALQQTAPDGTVGGAVRLWDPTLGVRAGDIVVIDPSGLGTCGQFEAEVADVSAPVLPGRPGGFVHLAHRTPTNGTWDYCVDLLAATAVPGASAPRFSATFRAGDYVLTRGNVVQTPLIHVGRPTLDSHFAVVWQDERPLAAACPLPPSVPWPAAPPVCDATCRDGCMLLQSVRLARRLGYVREDPVDFTGPAVAFTLAREAPTELVPRDFALTIDTLDGRKDFRVGPSSGSPTDPRAVVPYDRSPYAPEGGVRFLLPYAGQLFFDASPTQPGGGTGVVK
jgi:hypothetical protein